MVYFPRYESWEGFENKVTFTVTKGHWYWCH